MAQNNQNARRNVPVDNRRVLNIPYTGNNDDEQLIQRLIPDRNVHLTLENDPPQGVVIDSLVINALTRITRGKRNLFIGDNPYSGSYHGLIITDSNEQQIGRNLVVPLNSTAVGLRNRLTVPANTEIQGVSIFSERITPTTIQEMMELLNLNEVHILTFNFELFGRFGKELTYRREDSMRVIAKFGHYTVRFNDMRCFEVDYLKPVAPLVMCAMTSKIYDKSGWLIDYIVTRVPFMDVPQLVISNSCDEFTKFMASRKIKCHHFNSYVAFMVNGTWAIVKETILDKLTCDVMRDAIDNSDIQRILATYTNLINRGSHGRDPDLVFKKEEWNAINNGIGYVTEFVATYRLNITDNLKKFKASSMVRDDNLMYNRILTEFSIENVAQKRGRLVLIGVFIILFIVIALDPQWLYVYSFIGLTLLIELIVQLYSNPNDRRLGLRYCRKLIDLILRSVTGPFQLSLFGILFFFTLVKPAFSQDESETVYDKWIQKFCKILMLVLLLLIIVRKGSAESYEWQNLLLAAEKNRSICLARTIPYPEGSTLKKIEALYPICNKTEFGKGNKLFDYPVIENVKRKEGTMFIGPVFGIWPVTYNNDQKTLLVGITNRILKANDFECNEEFLIKSIREMKGYFNITTDLYGNPIPMITYNFRPITELEYLDRFPPAKRNRILKTKWKTRNDYSYPYECFVKREKMMAITKRDYEPGIPRVISGVSEESKLDFGVWFYNLSKAMKTIMHKRENIWFCSGATTQDYNDWADYCINRWGDHQYLAIWTDFSKYDKTQGPVVIYHENLFYKRCGFLNYYGKLGKMYLDSKETSLIKSRSNKLSFTVEGTRKTGDNDTSLGNTRSTVIAIGSFFKKHFGDLFNMAVLGDDNLVIVSYKRLVEIFETPKRMANLLLKHIQNMGFKLKLGYSRFLDRAQFLSCRFYQMVDGTYAIGKLPGKVMARIGHYLYEQRSKKEWNQIQLGTLISLEPSAYHVPFLRKYIQLVKDYLTAARTIPKIVQDMQHKRLYGQIIRTEICWPSFTEIYGLTEQDETEFAISFKRNIDKYGLRFCMKWDLIYDLFDIDMEFHLNVDENINEI